MMLHQTEARKEHIDVFIYEIGIKKTNLDKRRKIDSLKLSSFEWQNVSLFLGLLRYMQFAPALEAAAAKVDEYYNRTDTSDAYIVTMYLTPDQKGAHFKKHWSADLRLQAEQSMERVFAERWNKLHRSSSSTASASAPRLSRKVSTLLRELSDDEYEASAMENPSAEHGGSLSDQDKPYWQEYHSYLISKEVVPLGMSTVTWWGLNAARSPTWASLAHDFLSIMASSVSSERAFSQAGITISPRRNWLKADVVEALQFMKCLLKHDLIFREPGPSSLVEEDELAQDLAEMTLNAQEASVLGPWDLGLLDDDDMDLYE
ncbi:uncharacterized protein PHACADRAFT_193064 [Phanerochaete carnosa HHB-10118-sp]|uniref:HAT C-terminal dimerisation domain-containing protein n=1 Tax=Phanerochaete carnosa (strain HHB-10118-sp) TaxID=650164 RepID=K5W263_PHACS|nr:uncharacterized protein PHACADRAFT_193064 [Phanerochaete carnosa HHB-10118-sp]EKM57933.1 hypothetical protein PHACADRAFT_193064 [Phanerochaete carnosa HHB-10118-sp]